MAIVYIGVGSNIDPERNIPAAIDELSKRGVRIAATSRFYRTAPIGRPEQAPYANGVWQAETELEPLALKGLLREVERRLGRSRSEDKFAPRPIDLDILLFGALVTQSDALVLPDPHLLERPFLAACLLELDPDLRMPGSGERLALIAPGRTRLAEYSAITRAVCARLEAQ